MITPEFGARISFDEITSQNQGFGGMGEINLLAIVRGV